MLGGIGPVLSLMAFLRYLWRPAGNHSAARAMGRPSARSTRGLTWVLGLQRPGLSETRTLRWRKQDSNFRFLVGAGIPIDHAGCHPAVGSIERYAGDAAAFGQQLLLSPEVGRDRVRRTRALMIEIPAARSRELVPTRGKPRLSYATLMKIVRCVIPVH